MMKKIKDVDLEALSPSLDCSRETLSKLQQAIPEVKKRLVKREIFPSCISLCIVYSHFHSGILQVNVSYMLIFVTTVN